MAGGVTNKQPWILGYHGDGHGYLITKETAIDTWLPWKLVAMEMAMDTWLPSKWSWILGYHGNGHGYLISLEMVISTWLPWKWPFIRNYSGNNYSFINDNHGKRHWYRLSINIWNNLSIQSIVNFAGCL